jgi:hypothetical protein
MSKLATSEDGPWTNSSLPRMARSPLLCSLSATPFSNGMRGSHPQPSLTTVQRREDEPTPPLDQTFGSLPPECEET